MVFHWSLSDSKSPPFAWTLLSILADLNKAVVWMVSTRRLTFKSSSPCTNHLMTVPRALTTIGVTVTFMFQSFSVLLQGPGTYFSFRPPSVLSCGPLVRQSPLFDRFSFLLTITRSSSLAEIRWSVCISKSQRIVYILFSRTDSGLYIYHLLVWSNLNFLHNSQGITLPTRSCLIFNYFCANLLHSLIMWLIISSLSLYNLHLLF